MLTMDDRMTYSDYDARRCRVRSLYRFLLRIASRTDESRSHSG